MKKQIVKNPRKDDKLKAIGEKIRKIRLAKGLTQSELAFLCSDTDLSQISRMERGLVNFSVSFLYVIADKLDIPARDLLP